MLRTTLLASVATAACLTIPSFAIAQTKPATTAAAAKDVDVSEIVVTGSRIRRDTFSAPVPLAVVGGEQIRQSGGVSIADALTELPTLDASTNNQNSSGTLFQAGQARADIRGLGSSRTLVLVDGRRHVPTDASSPSVDLNMIPSMMVDRVEVVPGGGSAIYGSEAIAGVVNIIMKKQYEGFEVDAQGGISQEGDGATMRLSGLYGKKLLDDRLNVLVGGEIAKDDLVMQKDRSNLFPGIRRDNRLNPQPIRNPTSRSNTSPYATFQLVNSNNTATARAATIDVRNPTQIVALDPECATATVQPDCQNPALFYSAIYNALQGKSTRGTVRTYIDYKVTDRIKAFVDASYARAEAYGIFQPAFSSAAGGGTMPVSIKGDNAYLNGTDATATQLRTLWTTPTALGGGGLTLTSASSANVGKFWQEFGTRDVKTDRKVQRYVIGMNGDFDALDREVRWDWYAEYGKLDGTIINYNEPFIARVQQAVDAVNIGGQIVCRDPVARAAGCTPWDLIHGPSSAAVQWANANPSAAQTATQKVAAGNVNFDLFQLPAGPIGVAMGVEYRKEESTFAQDAVSATGATFINSVGTRAGSYHVTEEYGEIRVPLLKDLPLAYELSVEAAGRISQYSTIGDTNQRRYAVTWAPVKDIRIRASDSTAIRAPNIVELFSPQSVNFTTAASDPCDSQVFGQATAAQKAARLVTCAAAIPGYNPATFVSNFGTGRSSLRLINGGNPQLGPEASHSYQLGAVIQPRWAPGLSLSVDYFRYTITNQIGTVPINTVLGPLCYDSTLPYASNPFCALITRDRTGTNGGAVVGGVTQVQLTSVNVAKVKVEGIDVSAEYRADLEDVIHRDWGRVLLRLDGTDMYNWALQGSAGQAYTQLANNIANATPRWKANGSVVWGYDKLQLTWTTHFIGSMGSTTAFTSSQLTPFFTGDYFTHDLRAAYRLNDQIDLRGGVLNVTNEYPPFLPETFAGTGTGSSSYDNRGRYIFVGATLRY